jgi:Tfp pilus assembly protein PilX
MLAQQIQSGGKPPTPEQAAALQAAQQRQARLGTIGLVLLIIALLGMATARYL